MTTVQRRLRHLPDLCRFIEIAYNDNGDDFSNEQGHGPISAVFEIEHSEGMATLKKSVFSPNGDQVKPMIEEIGTTEETFGYLLTDLKDIALDHPEVMILRLGYSNEAKYQNTFEDFLNKQNE